MTANILKREQTARRKRKNRKRKRKGNGGNKTHDSKYTRADIKQEANQHRYKHKDLGKPEYQRFYKSIAWRQLRYLALRNSEGRCNCCGARASDGVVLHVDHIFPRSKFPNLELSIENIQVLCDDCNIGKGDWDTTNWKQHWEEI